MTNETRKRPPTPHRLHRHHVGPLTIAPGTSIHPQYQTGPRHGQQWALVRKAAAVDTRVLK
jgi:hypothetical protein